MTDRSPLAVAVRRLLGRRRDVRVLALRRRSGLLLVPEDLVPRRIVERNARVLRRSGWADVPREPRRQRRAKALGSGTFPSESLGPVLANSCNYLTWRGCLLRWKSHAGTRGRTPAAPIPTRVPPRCLPFLGETRKPSLAAMLKPPPAPQFHPAIHLGPSPIDRRGVFTSEAIKAGSIIMIWGGRMFTKKEVDAGEALIESVTAVGENLYVGAGRDERRTIDQFLNHSCDPNSWMQNAFTLIARRDLQAGEEITADYALWEIDADWKLARCRCNTSLCRSRIAGRDWRLPDLQFRYRGHFIPYLNEQIEIQFGRESIRSPRIRGTLLVP